MLRAENQKFIFPKTFRLLRNTLLILLTFGIADAKQGSTRLEYYRTCSKKSGAPVGYMLVENARVHKSKNIGLIEAELTVTKDLPTILPADVAIMRCKSSSGRDCVTLLKYKHPDICPSLASKTSLWGAFVSHIKPSLLCPIKQNRYRIENATFDGDKFSSYFQAVPGEQNKVTYFILKLFSNQNNEDVACLDIMFRVLRP